MNNSTLRCLSVAIEMYHSTDIDISDVNEFVNSLFQCEEFMEKICDITSKDSMSFDEMIWFSRFKDLCKRVFFRQLSETLDSLTKEDCIVHIVMNYGKVNCGKVDLVSNKDETSDEFTYRIINVIEHSLKYQECKDWMILICNSKRDCDAKFSNNTFKYIF